MIHNTSLACLDNHTMHLMPSKAAINFITSS
jgi:hypothetical protein